MALKVFPIDTIRQVISQTFLIEKIKSDLINLLYGQHAPRYLGGDNEIMLFSSYEQLNTQEEVDRYVENFRQLTEQQNRRNVFANGVLLAPENPSITNINSKLIIPMSFICNFRARPQDRDILLDTFNNMIDILKGRKQNMAIFEDGKVFTCGVLGNNIYGTPKIKKGDFIGYVYTNNINSDVTTILTNLVALGFEYDSSDPRELHFYIAHYNKLKVVVYDETTEKWVITEDNVTHKDIIFPPSKTDFKMFTISLSFESMRCDIPFTLNSVKECNISFGGSATLCDSYVRLGNDLTKLSIKKVGISGVETNPYSTENGGNAYWLEPTEMPSNNSVNSLATQLISSKFLNKTHANGIAPTLQYTFIYDREVGLLNQIYLYGRYGKNSVDAYDISPNTLYEITEYYVSWGNVERRRFLAKLTEDIEISNSETDVVTISVSFQVQESEYVEPVGE